VGRLSKTIASNKMLFVISEETEHLSCITVPVANVSLTFASPTEKIKKLEHDSSSLQSAKARLENECKTLQQKVEILGELYQQKEMALQK